MAIKFEKLKNLGKILGEKATEIIPQATAEGRARQFIAEIIQHRQTVVRVDMQSGDPEKFKTIGFLHQPVQLLRIAVLDAAEVGEKGLLGTKAQSIWVVSVRSDTERDFFQVVPTRELRQSLQVQSQATQEAMPTGQAEQSQTTEAAIRAKHVKYRFTSGELRPRADEWELLPLELGEEPLCVESCLTQLEGLFLIDDSLATSVVTSVSTIAAGEGVAVRSQKAPVFSGLTLGLLGSSL